MLHLPDRHAARLSFVRGFYQQGIARLQPAEQYLAYLSIKFLLPKLVQAKELLLERYRNAMLALRGLRSPADELLKTHLSEHAAEMVMLQEAAEAVARA